MFRRLRLTVLVGLVVVLMSSFATSAYAQTTSGYGYGSVGVGEAQLGKPFVWGTDGPYTFSCSGLMRYILRVTGVDAYAPWIPEEYLSRYAPVSYGDLQPGDIVIYPGWATMYVGNGMVLNANAWKGYVTETPMVYAGTPLGVVRP